MTTRRVRRDEEGSALILALVFLSLFGLLIAAMLGQVDANIRTTLVVRTHETKVYGADAGIDYAVQALQFDDTLCPNADVGPDSWNAAPVVPVSSGVTVDVTCQTTEGSVLGLRGHAIVTTDPHGSGATSLDTSNGSIDRAIEGPVYVTGDVTLAKPVTVKGANFTQAAPCQSTPIDRLTVTPAPFAVKCSSTASPDEEHDLPPFPSGAPMAAAGDNGNPCRTFMPGIYKTAPSLANQNFFASGVYYFEDIGNWSITQELFGGLPRPTEGEPKSLTEAPCVGTDPGTGQGVMFVFGGNSRFILGNGAHVELFSPTETATTPGDPGFSIRAVRKLTAGNATTDDTLADVRWKPSTPGMTIVDVDGGNTRDLAIHGLVYTPEQVVNLFVTGGAVNAQFLNGAKVLRLGLATSNSGTGLAISTRRGPGRRKVTIVSKATEPGGRTVEARAVVNIENDEARTVTVVSQSVQ